MITSNGFLFLSCLEQSAHYTKDQINKHPLRLKDMTGVLCASYYM